MKDIYQKFEKICPMIFNFLEKDFRLNHIETEKNNYGIYVVYKSATSFLRISLELREGGIFIYLGRLEDGEIPPYPIFIHQSTILHAFYLDDLINLKESQSKKQQNEEVTLSNIEKILTEKANDVRKYASDILQGNFEIFHELENVVKART